MLRKSEGIIGTKMITEHNDLYNHIYRHGAVLLRLVALDVAGVGLTLLLGSRGNVGLGSHTV